MSEKLVIWLALLFVAGLPAAVGSAFYFSKKQSERDSKRLAELAESWNLTAESGLGRFVGEYQGRGLEIFRSVKTNGSRRWSGAIGLRLALRESSPHQGHARCARISGQIQTFEQAFPKAIMGLETLSTNQKSALVDFVKQRGCLFFEAEKRPHRLEFTFRSAEHTEPQLRVILEELDQLATLLEKPH